VATPAWPGDVLNNTKSGSTRLLNITLPAAGVVAKAHIEQREKIKERRIKKIQGD